ncbi:MAG: hypothetical protein GX568_04020 [Candidatus Gastranaerophilales bacterium]|nr:hypothetical protein [Candidatus Gastranaerophilales bacterium]
MKKLTLTVLSAKLNMSYNGTVKKVQKLISNPKYKDKIKLTEELNELGRRVKTVVIAEDLYNKLKEEHAGFNQPIEPDEIYEFEPVQREIEPVKEVGSNDFMEKLVNELIDTRKQLINYAEQAGQVRLLTDTLMNTEKDVKYWQSKFFELQYELKKVQEENEELKKKINERKWWKFR